MSDHAGIVDPTEVAADRLALLLDAVVSMAADLTLDGVLDRIVGTSRRLTGAEYAALGVLHSGPQKGLRTFVHAGMAPDLVEQIGHLPEGRGIVGLLIDRPEPLRLREISAHPDSYGFPDRHPPMSSFLGVPIRVRERVFGNLYLTEKSGGREFTDEDEGIVMALAAAAGVVIENAQLYEEAARREEWLVATAEIAGHLAETGTADDSLPVVATRARQLASADVAWLAVQAGDHLELRALSGPPVDLEALDPLTQDGSLCNEVFTTGVPVATEDIAQDPRRGIMERIEGWPLIGPVIVVPLRAGKDVVGALALGWGPEHADRYHELDPRLLLSFAEQAALALQLVRSQENERRLALFEDRDRIGRDLHDLVIQRIFAVGLSLQGVSRVSDVLEVNERIDAAVEDLDATIKDIRRSIFALGTAETSADIQSELTKLVDRAAMTLKFRPTLRFSGPVRSMVSEEVAPHLLAVLGETLSNAIRHSGASNIDVRISAGESLDLVVADNGCGLPADARESGLLNIRDRAARLGGACSVSSSDQGTTVTWSVPPV